LQARRDALFQLSLTRIDSRSGADPVPAVPGDAQVWRDWDGVPRAYGFTFNGDHWLRLSDVGSFRFTPGGRLVEAVVSESSSAETVKDAFERHVLPFALHAQGLELLHGSAVVARDRAVAFCGSSSAGKSTLAYTLGRRGHPVLADDAVLFETVDDRIDARPLPFTLRISSRSVLAGGEAHGSDVPVLIAPDEGPFPLAAVFVIERLEGPGGDFEITPLAPAAAFPLLLYHAHCFSYRNQERTRVMIERYLKLADRVPAFELRYRPDLDRLPELLDGVERALP
jgi:hypothetical protein